MESKTRFYYKNIVKIIFLIILALTTMLTGCNGGDKFEEYYSGQKIEIDEINYNTFIRLSKKHKFNSADGLVNDLTYQFSCYGYKEISYYNIKLSIKITFESLNESGVYELITIYENLHLDFEGYAFLKNVKTFNIPSRNVKNIKIEVNSASGFVVKK